ncbi:hypothetical protein KBY55_17885 [Streptomyces sp. b94]|uniref:hypothetical protein n=1 Tax=Streptomyces sp. b94 TaxID=1827634 RepID=UPI001B38D499|nr:hypothetical protein [Streptomyces sp. b94]MBQ1097905.1 hypothetical protein [Streptomyces sp. b94]
MTVAPVTVETVGGRDVRDAVEFSHRAYRVAPRPAARLAGPPEALRPFGTGTGTGTGVRLRADEWPVTAVRP